MGFFYIGYVCPTCGTQPVKYQGGKFKNNKMSQLNFLKHTTILHHFKDTLLLDVTTLSDFKKAYSALSWPVVNENLLTGLVKCGSSVITHNS